MVERPEALGRSWHPVFFGVASQLEYSLKVYSLVVGRQVTVDRAIGEIPAVPFPVSIRRLGGKGKKTVLT
jgi:hypothetical protein